MYKFPLLLLFALATNSSPPPCAEVTHDECSDDNNSFMEIDAQNKEFCRLICLGVAEERCNFFIFDKKPFTNGNCRLYDISFSLFIQNCNEVAGPKTTSDDCDLLNPSDNSCQVYRDGKCHFEAVEEKHAMSSWKNCQAACKSTSECQYWRFEREERQCLILYSSERTCDWEFSPREPTWEDCGVSPPKTTEKPSPTTTSRPSRQCAWERGNSCYNYDMKEIEWADAEHFCKNTYNGHLVAPSTEDEMMFLDEKLNELVENEPDLHKRFWIGANLDDKEHWFWSNGETYDWDYHAPDGVEGGRDRLYLLGGEYDGKGEWHWHSNEHWEVYPSLCESYF